MLSRAERAAKSSCPSAAEPAGKRLHLVALNSIVLVTRGRRPPSNAPVSLASSLAELGSDVLTRACAGERESLEVLVRVIQKPFYNLALRMLHDRALAEDAAQECLLRVVTHLSQYRQEAKFATWAMRVAVNAVLDFKNGVARSARLTFDAFENQLDLGLDESAVERPEDALLLKQVKKLCNQVLLQCLDGDHRIAFVLGEILEFESTEAAEILDIEPAAFRKRLSRARADLTILLSKKCGVHTATAACACHRQAESLVKRGLLDPSQLDVHIGDLVQLRAKLARLDADQRTTAIYRGDEASELRGRILDSVRDTLFAMRH
jgi:RNA polymerase sigma factor (sigma-70 family)